MVLLILECEQKEKMVDSHIRSRTVFSKLIRDRSSLLGIIIIAIIVLSGTFAPVIAPMSPYT